MFKCKKCDGVVLVKKAIATINASLSLSRKNEAQIYNVQTSLEKIPEEECKTYCSCEEFDAENLQAECPQCYEFRDIENLGTLNRSRTFACKHCADTFYTEYDWHPMDKETLITSLKNLSI